jgi:ParB family chromosome partitioning protein
MNESLYKINDMEQINDRIEVLSEDRIIDYRQHIFKPYEGQQLEELKTSIEECGIISPVIVRKISERYYEILSGHNRVRAARDIGMSDIPVVIKDKLSEDQVLEIVLSANLNQRSINDLLPSERAAVIAQYYELLKRTGKRNDFIVSSDVECNMTCGVIKVGEKFELSGMQISRYIRINSLINGLKHLLDEGKLSIKVGVILSDLSLNTQELICPFLCKYKLDINKAKELVVLDNNVLIDINQLNGFFDNDRSNKSTGKISLEKREFEQFFDKSVKQSDIGNRIIKILEDYVKTNGVIH